MLFGWNFEADYSGPAHGDKDSDGNLVSFNGLVIYFPPDLIRTITIDPSTSFAGLIPERVELVGDALYINLQDLHYTPDSRIVLKAEFQNTRPSVSLAPISSPVLVSNAVTLTATAEDTDGFITNVSFYVDSRYIGQASTAPFSIAWRPTLLGPYKIYASAFDDQGAIANSETNTVRVTTARAAPFRNLDFEEAVVVSSDVRNGEIAPGVAFPGWRVGTNGWSAPNYTLYNSLTLGSTAQVLMGPELPGWQGPRYAPLQGFYSALLLYSPVPSLGIAALSQTGTIPEDATFVSFMGNIDSAGLTIDGHAISLAKTPSGRVAGDISAFAGKEVEIMFFHKEHFAEEFYFDDVQFTAEIDPSTSKPSGPKVSISAITLSSDPSFPEIRMELNWNTVPGRTYQLQTAQTVNGPWLNVDPPFKASSTNSGNHHFDVQWEEPTYERLEPQRFFRVRVAP